jgi:hypothetical protein
LTQLDVALTDYALALKCLAFVCFLRPVRRQSPPLGFWFVVFFLSTAFAAAAGGTVHGFFEASASTGYRVLWPLTLIVIGITALSGAQIAAGVSLDVRSARRLLHVSAGLFSLYCVIVLFVTDNFLAAILAYLPVVLFLGWAFLRAYRRTRRPAFRKGVAGVCIMLVAAGAQHARLGLHPRYFNYNALYHVLQAAGLFLIFVTAQELTQAKRATQPDLPQRTSDALRKP